MCCNNGMKQYMLWIFVILCLCLILWSKEILRFDRYLDTNIYSQFQIRENVSELSLRNVSDHIETKLTKYINAAKFADCRNKSHYMKNAWMNGGLGNLMFERASAIGIALQNGLIPISEKSIPFFEKSRSNCDFVKMSALTWTLVGVASPGIYQHFTHNLSLLHPHENIKINGYLQSYKYFHKFESTIKETFTFNKTTREQTANFFKRCNQTLLSSSVWIGIHVRRGDYLSKRAIYNGKVIPRVGYFQHAVNFFRSKILSPITFIVCGNDPEWNEKFLFPLHENVIISKGNSREVDLAILISCDHVIMSVGTFGWWGGYLSGGTVIYYSNFTRPGSNMDKDFTEEDFYPPDWIGMI